MKTMTSRDMIQCAMDSSRYWSVLLRRPFEPASGWKIRADMPIFSVRCVSRFNRRSDKERNLAETMRCACSHGVLRRKYPDVLLALEELGASLSADVSM